MTSVSKSWSSQDGARLSIHPLFNSNDADLVIESSDGVIFRLHSKNLKVQTGKTSLSEVQSCRNTFEGSDSEKLEIACLPESSRILETVFSFMYPQKHPDLNAFHDFRTVAAIAEAVGKYQLFSGMNTCEIRLREFLPSQAMEIFKYAIKYKNEDLINETALIFSRSPLRETLELLPAECVLPWVKYQKWWSSLFSNVIRKYIETFTPSKYIQSCSSINGYGGRGCCQGCYDTLLVWASKLEKGQIGALSDSGVEKITTPTTPTRQHSTNDIDICYSCKDECQFLALVEKHARDSIKAIPPFITFMNGA